MATEAGILSGKIEVNGVKLYYNKVGNGPNVLLLIPGATGTTLDFKAQLDTLNRNLFSIVAFDPRGYGKSRPPDRDFPLDFFHRDAKDARDLMEALGHDKFSMIGNSDGVMTAVIIAATWPERVNKLVLCGGNPYVTKRDVELYASIRDVNSWDPESRQRNVDIYGSLENAEQLWHNWCDGMLQIWEMKGGDICKEESKKVDCPTLILHGKLDPYVLMEQPEYLAKTINGSKLVVWPDAGHDLRVFPDRFNKEVEDFFTG